jgi:hypothetical protein
MYLLHKLKIADILVPKLVIFIKKKVHTTLLFVRCEFIKRTIALAIQKAPEFLYIFIFYFLFFLFFLH